MRRVPVLALTGLALLAPPPPAAAQYTPVALPPSILIGNYDRLNVGQEEAIESGAFVARVGDSTAGWYNPAGLARVKRTVIGASATGYQGDKLRLDGTLLSGGASTVYQLPSYFGAVLGSDVLQTDAWRIGFTVTKPISWTETLDNLDSTSTRVSYSSRVSLSTLVPMVSVAWTPLEGLRLGAGLGAAVTSFGETQILSEQLLTATTARAVVHTVNADGYVYNVTGTLGAQWDVTGNLMAGATIRFPGARVLHSGSLTYNDVANTGSPWHQVFFSDGHADFDYRLPLNVNIGLAWRSRAFEVELDLRWYGPIDTYHLFTSGQPVQIVTTGANGEPVVNTQPFPGVTNGARSVWNFAVGGRYNVDESWSVHAGFHSDASPTNAAGAAVFRSVNMYGVTAGAKLRGSHLSGSLGLGFSWGSSDPFTLTDPLTADPVTTRLQVSSLALLYALAYQF